MARTRLCFTSYVDHDGVEDVEVRVEADLSKAEPWEGGGTVVELASAKRDGVDILDDLSKDALASLRDDAVQEADDRDDAALAAADDDAYERSRDREWEERL